MHMFSKLLAAALLIFPVISIAQPIDNTDPCVNKSSPSLNYWKKQHHLAVSEASRAAERGDLLNARSAYNVADYARPRACLDAIPSTIFKNADRAVRALQVQEHMGIAVRAIAESQYDDALNALEDVLHYGLLGKLQFPPQYELMRETAVEGYYGKTFARLDKSFANQELSLDAYWLEVGRVCRILRKQYQHDSKDARCANYR